jgi:hypothetical protein
MKGPLYLAMFKMHDNTHFEIRIKSLLVGGVDYNFACSSVRVWNLVCDIKGGEQGVEENIWTKEGWSDRRLETFITCISLHV